MLDPISTAVASYVGDKLINAVESTVRTHVIERWTRYRAHQFFVKFAESLLDVASTDGDIAATLDQILSDETKSEVVFDAYRSVCLSKSKDIGPRIIALLTAELVITERVADADDDLIFLAAEELSDPEFGAYVSYASDVIARTSSTSNYHNQPKYLRDGCLEVRLFGKTTDLNWHQKDPASFGPINLMDQFGVWAHKLERLGLVHEDVREREWNYQEDSERHIDQSGVAREISWWLTLSPAALKLAEYARRAALDTRT